MTDRIEKTLDGTRAESKAGRPSRRVPQNNVDFKSAASKGLEMIQDWLPNGHQEGSEWVSKNPTRTDLHEGSFKVNTNTGAWSDFATGDKGGDAVSLLAYILGISQVEAARKIIGSLGPNFDSEPSQTVVKPQKKGSPVFPVPVNAQPIGNVTWSSYALKNWGSPRASWSYTNETGDELFRVIRFEKADETKSVIPFHYDDSDRWKPGMPIENDRPLFNLPEIVKSEGPVLVVEGEKCASISVPGFTVTCWQGGCKAVNRTDWTQLAGRRVVVWPDADEPGIKASLAIAEKIAGVEILQIENRSEGWDIADADSEGIDLTEFIANCPRIESSNIQKRQSVNTSEVVELDRQSEAMVNVLAKSGAEIFVMGGSLVRILRQEPARPQLLGLDTLRHEASKYVQFLETRFNKKTEDFQDYEIHPPILVIKDALARGSWPFPTLEGMAPHPVLGTDGSLGNRSGYHSASRLWVDLSPALEGLNVPKEPKREEVLEAVAMLESLLIDFPFAENGSKAGALAMFLTALCRPLISGSCPIFLISAPAPGTGKTLLAQVLLRIVVGAEPPLLGETRDSDEFAKQLTACLMLGPVALVVDNLNGKIDSGVLASVATAGTYRGRILGKSEMVDLKVKALMVLTANNPQTSNEIARRCVPIRIVPNSENPYQREGFQHPDLKAYVDEKRTELVYAGLVLARSWIAAGCPKPKAKPLGSFEEWSRVVGGILEHAEVTGFLENTRDFYASADTETQAWNAFVEGWFREHDTRQVRTSDLVDLALTLGVIEESRAGTPKGNSTSLGRQLAKLTDRVFGNFRIVRGPLVSNSQTWKLSKIKDRDIRTLGTSLYPSCKSFSKVENSTNVEQQENVPQVHDVPEPATKIDGLGIF